MHHKIGSRNMRKSARPHCYHCRERNKSEVLSFFSKKGGVKETRNAGPRLYAIMTAWQCPQNLLRAENSTRWTPAKSVPRVGLGVKESEILYHWVNVSCTILWPLPQCVSYLNRHKAFLCLGTLLWSFLHRLIVIYIPVSTYCRLKKSPNIRTHRIHIISLFSILGANSRWGGGGAYTDQTTLLTLIISFTQHIWFFKMIFCSSLTE